VKLFSQEASILTDCGDESVTEGFAGQCANHGRFADAGVA